MRILDRYVLKSTLGLFLGCLLIFLSLYIIVDIFSHLDDILKQKVHIQLLLEYYLSYLPIIFTQVSPMACLLAVLYTFGNLNRNNEIIAMRASGMNIFQISRTVIILGVLVSALVFWVSDRFVPAALVFNERTKAAMEAGSKKALEKQNEVFTNLCMYGLRNRLFFVNKFYPGQGKMQNIVILEHDEKQNIVKKIVANRGEYKDGVWRFYQSITYNFDVNGQIINEPQYMEEEVMAIPENPREFVSQRQRPDFMNIAQLEDYIWKLSKSGATTVIRNLKVDLYSRFTMPLTSLIIILLGIPFSLRMKRRATGLSSIGLSLMMGFLYYVLTAVGTALGKAGILAPLISVSLSHVIALFSALYLINTLP
jgi:lipopolysaccharide export system permease protein